MIARSGIRSESIAADALYRLPGDPRQFVRLPQAGFAAALGISVHTPRNREQAGRHSKGPGMALLRIATGHPGSCAKTSQPLKDIRARPPSAPATCRSDPQSSSQTNSGTSHVVGKSEKCPHNCHCASAFPAGREASPHSGGSGKPTQVFLMRSRSSPSKVVT